MKTKKPKPLGKQKNTARGFKVVRFKDHYGASCYLQQSSLALCTKPGASAVWLGVDDIDPKILASKAAEHGIKTDATCGWIPYTKIPDDVLVTSQMHLNREQVEGLVLALQNWLKHGVFVKRK